MMMTQDTFEYKRTTGKPFDAVADAVSEAAAKRNFRTLYVHDVHQTLADKGLTLGPYKIVELCNAHYAHSLLSKHPSAGLMLPCPIAVYEANGETIVSTMRPTVMRAVMNDFDLGTIPEEVEPLLREIVDEAVSI
jgi:uncharacterized protein (DUF302 family)